jgi:metal-responsive CopG/Arc/MetJ family transcriptional regulator
MNNKEEKKYSRRIQCIVGGALLKKFDADCALRQMNESEGIREALRDKYLSNDKANREGGTKENPFFKKPSDNV